MNRPWSKILHLLTHGFSVLARYVPPVPLYHVRPSRAVSVGDCGVPEHSHRTKKAAERCQPKPINRTARIVPTKEEQAADARRLFEMVLSGATYSQAATTFGTSMTLCRKRFFRLARLTVRRGSPAHRYEPPFDEQQVAVMRRHKEAWLQAYDQAVAPLSLSECQRPETVSICQLKLSSYTETSLRNADITTLADLLNTTEHQILINRRFGEHTLREIRALLTRLGLSFKPSEESVAHTTVRRLTP
jgi:transposase